MPQTRSAAPRPPGPASGFTPPLPDERIRRGYRAVIVGDGLMGLFAAWVLATDHGMTGIAVLPATGQPLLRPAALLAAPDTQDPALGALWTDAFARWDELPGVLGLSLPGSRRPLFTLARTERDERLLRRQAGTHRLLGIGGDWVSPTAVHDACPPFDPAPWRGAAVQRRARLLRPALVARTLRQRLRAAGVHLAKGLPVTALRRDETRILGVERPGSGPGPDPDRMDADHVILCGETTTPALLATIGLDLPLRPRAVTLAETEPLSHALPVALGLREPAMTLVQEDGGRILAAGIAASLDSEGLVAAMLALIPTLSRVRLARLGQETGLTTPDGLPLVGATPLAGLWISAGWACPSGAGSSGIAPVAGRLLAEAVAAGRQPDSLAAFAPDRCLSA